jgi:phenylalanyl-tRNA synthetase beta chain
LAEVELEVVMRHIRHALKYSAMPKFPAVTRDIALVGPRNVAHEQIVSMILEAGGALLESATLFDVFTDDTGEKLPADARSMAYALTFRAPDRTLKDADVSAVHERIVRQLADKLALTLRA